MSLLSSITSIFRAAPKPTVPSVKEESTSFVKKYTAAPDTLAEHTALEPRDGGPYGKRGNVYFTAAKTLPDVIEALQVTQMAAIVRARMSSTTFQRLRPLGLSDVTIYDRFMPPGRIELLLNDGARAWLQVSLDDAP